MFLAFRLTSRHGLCLHSQFAAVLHGFGLSDEEAQAATVLPSRQQLVGLFAEAASLILCTIGHKPSIIKIFPAASTSSAINAATMSRLLPLKYILRVADTDVLMWQGRVAIRYDRLLDGLPSLWPVLE